MPGSHWPAAIRAIWIIGTIWTIGTAATILQEAFESRKPVNTWQIPKATQNANLAHIAQ